MKIFQTPPSANEWTIPMIRVTFCWTWIIIVSEMNINLSQTSQRKRCASYLSNGIKGLGFSWINLPSFGAFKSVTILMLCVVFTDACNINIFQFYNHSIDMHCGLFHVNFEDELSISLLRDKATRSKNLLFESESC